MDERDGSQLRGRVSSAPMNTQTVAIICAGLGVLFSIVYLVLGVTGIRLLRDLRDRESRS